MSENERIQSLEREILMLRQGVRQAERMRRLWQEALEELKATKHQLEARNSELSVLHNVSYAASQTIDLDELFPRILDAMEGALPQAKGLPKGIFMVDGDVMHLVAQRGAGPEFEALHKGMKVGACLCGCAAATGEIVISHDCLEDDRYTLTPFPGERHAHVIVPLKSKGRAVGVFYYYLPCGTIIDERKSETLKAIGQQLGIAIENAKLYEETRRLSLRDALTGLANRRLMELMLDRNLPNVARYRRPLSLMMIDIDFFKRYNDTYGHPEGDRLLASVASILQRETRENDLAVRYGGEEFMVILPETELEGARTVAERLRKSVEVNTTVTISIGVAAARPGLCERQLLINAADQALYRAKSSGRNRVALDGEEPQSHAAS